MVFFIPKLFCKCTKNIKDKENFSNLIFLYSQKKRFCLKYISSCCNVLIQSKICHSYKYKMTFFLTKNIKIQMAYTLYIQLMNLSYKPNSKKYKLFN